MSKKILIVEDEQEFFFFYEMMLEDTDYTIVHALDGKQALEMIETEKPDLIILDLLLDKLPGDEFLKQLKSSPPYKDIPVIVASSFSPHSNKTIFEIDPDVSYLEKPFTQERLMEVIKRKIE
ncbi:hypothetical protein KsCSTR_02850 [Candidatus Kuenenia stuttgartiensis]|uniref:Response regulatory domain-containing protein n=1 Tax=Kuenenia stuttgartiensis TaxID=174633 RepID=Q1PY38_KUEST|nr:MULTISPECIES: response regulator [Kuenenia]MBE7546326.1 response regulator [Planctomycetia bacterium]MBW7942431.1 response regulator [Candidatus Kuenenia stuttgartiensis]MBZ0192042.1 response regulator [Candidatus Kuenenia stuttgartiensis]MCF6151185.1 response regulator [Candidatus Kuenenia stuttgartiensis]MCL4725788.1 response regulator [Candidatus Kuenenia stuttgartiensis]